MKFKELVKEFVKSCEQTKTLARLLASRIQQILVPYIKDVKFVVDQEAGYDVIIIYDNPNQIYMNEELYDLFVKYFPELAGHIAFYISKQNPGVIAQIQQELTRLIEEE